MPFMSLHVPAGKKIPDYWEASKKLLNDATKFLESLLSYDKDNIPESVITKIEPYINSEEFTPEAVARVSKACTSICMWVRAMHLYHTVALAVSTWLRLRAAAGVTYRCVPLSAVLMYSLQPACAAFECLLGSLLA
jgi:hypothetical protein